MTSSARKIEQAVSGMVKNAPNLPAFVVTSPRSVSIRAGSTIEGYYFDQDTPIEIIDADQMVAGSDYGIAIIDGVARAWRAIRIPVGEGAIGGFHFAPGGNAAANAGGDGTPAINPCSLWDLNFRPICPDPRGMTLVDRDGLKFWADIYLTGKDHLEDGTSKFGVTIADHYDAPQNPAGGYFDRFDFETAKAVVAHHGKALMTEAEFCAFAHGVTEYSACRTDPKITGLDAKRTSQVGGMQSTGNMWQWGIDKNMQPRASVFGGSWLNDGKAGSRFAVVGNWPVNSYGDLGARGRSDHLQLD